MFLHRFRFLLPLLSLAMLATAGLVVAWAVTAPDPQCKLSRPAAAGNAASAPASSDSNTIELETFEPVFRRRFQNPLFDPPPPPPPPPVKKAPPPQPAVKLLATMPEPNGRGLAMFLVKNSQVIKGVGSKIDDGATVVEIVKITDSTVVLKQGERLITLELSE